MKRSSQHAFEPEEIMAYLDGELAANEAAALANHLEHCSECQSVAMQLRQVSERMLEFRVEPCALTSADVIQRAEDVKRGEAATGPGAGRRPRRRVLRVLAWAGGAAAVVMLVLFSVPNMLRVKFSPADLRKLETENLYQPKSGLAQRATGLSAEDKNNNIPAQAFTRLRQYALPFQPKSGLTLPAPAGGGGGGVSQNENGTAVPEPMIEQMTSVTILASNYDQASKAVERITTQHGGYVQDLSAETETGTARSLSATLRVPEKQIESFLTDLGRLGHVEQESRSNQEITDQYIDLTARLRNARAEEQRILEILKTRQGKLSDVLQAERELARVGGEIESMEGQRKYMEHEVSYATVQVQLNEVYRAQLNPGASSTSTRIRNSLVEGFRNLSDGLVSIVIFAFTYGPSILLWLALIGLPAWFGWRRFRRGRGSELQDLKPR